MPDATTIIDGRIASDVRFGDANGTPVANVRVLAGRTRKDEQGNWHTLSTTAYDVAFWREHHDLIASLGMNKGDSVTITGTITGLESYQGQNGESLSAKVNGTGIRHFAKRDQQPATPAQQPQPNQNGQWGGGTGGNDGWGNVTQPGQGFTSQGGYDSPPF